MQHAALALSILLAAAATPGCTREDSRSSTVTTYSTQGGEDVHIGDTIKVDVVGSVVYRTSIKAVHGQPTVTQTFVNDLPLEILDEAIVIGGQRFEGLQPGDVVRIAADGVSVNGERRWDMPTR